VGRDRVRVRLGLDEVAVLRGLPQQLRAGQIDRVHLEGLEITTPPRRRSAATNGPGPANWSMST
jgi:hypothetical protein